MKKDTWEKDLEIYIEEIRNKPFDWGIHDCVVFANQAIKVQTGKGFFDEFLPDYDTAIKANRTYRTMLVEMKVATIKDAIDTKLTRFIGMIPPKGSIVCAVERQRIEYGIGHKLGVAIDHRAGYLGWNGLQFEKIKSGDVFWTVD
tara:strand:+ start:1254 stop:1688 length:435 start_codon:yes stop_codon:yes gene_type:complete